MGCPSYHLDGTRQSRYEDRSVAVGQSSISELAGLIGAPAAYLSGVVQGTRVIAPEAQPYHSGE